MVEPTPEQLLEQYLLETDGCNFWYLKPKDHSAGRNILGASPICQALVLRVIVSKMMRKHNPALLSLKAQLMNRDLPLSAEMLEQILEASIGINSTAGQWSHVIRSIQRFVNAGNDLTHKLRADLEAMRDQITANDTVDIRKIKVQVNELLGQSQTDLPDPGEPWADAVRSEFCPEQTVDGRTMMDVQDTAAHLVAEYWEQTDHNNGAKLKECAAGRAILAGGGALQVAVLFEEYWRVATLFAADEQPQGHWYYTAYTFFSDLLSRFLPLTAEDVERLLPYAEAYYRGYRTEHQKSVIKQVERFAESHDLTPTMREALRRMRDDTRFYNGQEERKLRGRIAQLLGESDAGQPDVGEPWADAARGESQGTEAWAAIFTHAATADGGKPSAKWLAQAEKNRAAVGDGNFTGHVASWLALAAPPPPFTQKPPQLPPNYDMLQGEQRSEAWRRFQEENKDALATFATARAHYFNSISEKNIAILKGLAWYSVASHGPELARALAHLAEAAFSNVPERGAWAKSAGNAAIWALGQMPGGVGVGPLARLRTKLRDRGALKLITTSIEAAAKNAGMTVDELEDLAVPTGGLDADGTRRETFGEDGSATLTLDTKTAKTNLQWFGPNGTPRKAVPAAVKKNWPAEVKALKAAEEEIKQALTAQAARFDRFLLDEREWSLAVWQERYLSHPILGNLARRLIWVRDGIPSLPAAPTHPLPEGEVGRLAEPEGSPNPSVYPNNRDAGGPCKRGTSKQGGGSVRLWHPLGAPPDDVLHWRQTLEERAIVQPFKQAHREVYLLTDAERNTRTYSNRFAAHVLKQHQFNSLCILRGWKNQLRLMVDASYSPATRDLPWHHLRAEFWVEGIGDDYGTDTNETGTYLRVATDQVRFYSLDAPRGYGHAYGGGYFIERHATDEPIPLEDVPPLAFSEVMRDIDLFVGVASLGNDPTWADGGPQGRFVAYWQDYSFGELTETAKTRADVLARLLPRLKIATRCRLDGRFLIVRGDLRTYKIHLGSGNILMEPNDQYLCIVPSSRAEDFGDLFLPFEGDRTLAVILSKAFLLADDTHIADSTITRQIKV